MERKEIIQEMQMCLLCAPFFDRLEAEEGKPWTQGTLAHQIGFHVRIHPNGAEECYKPKGDKQPRR